MKSRRQQTLVLILSAGYLSVVTFGHCFHTHRSDRPAGCGCCAAARQPKCDAHHHDAHPAGHSSERPADGLGRSPSPASAVALVDHGCPVCGFFAHHCVPTGAADPATTGHTVHRVVASVSLVAAGRFSGPQQPRAPPLTA